MGLELFSTRIKELRTSMDMTQLQFANLIGVSTPTLSGYENDLKKPSIAVFVEIAQNCKVSTDWLCGLSDKRSTSDELSTYSDLFREFIKLYKNFNFDIETQNDPRTHREDTTIFSFTDEVIAKFINDWMNMIALMDSESIDYELYNMWIEKTLDKHDYEIIDNEPFK